MSQPPRHEKVQKSHKITVFHVFPKSALFRGFSSDLAPCRFCVTLWVWIGGLRQRPFLVFLHPLLDTTFWPVKTVNFLTFLMKIWP